jgi:hypothetical protein
MVNLCNIQVIRTYSQNLQDGNKRQGQGNTKDFEGQVGTADQFLVSLNEHLF